MLKYYWFLKCCVLATSGRYHHARVFGLDYYFSDGYGLASLQRVYCSSYRLAEYLPEHPLILDVGANIGQFNFFCRQYLKARRIVSVEPIPDCVEILKRNCQEVDDCLEYAVTSETRPVGLFVDSISSQLSSCVRDDSKGPGREVEVQGVCLDNLVEKLGLDSIDLLKIDTEGNEYDVLLGGEKTLGKTKTILIEMSIFRKSLGNLFSIGYLIQGRGFTLVELFSLSGHHPEDADGLFVRK